MILLGSGPLMFMICFEALALKSPAGLSPPFRGGKLSYLHLVQISNRLEGVEG